MRKNKMGKISPDKFFEEIENETISYYVDKDTKETTYNKIKDVINPKKLIDYFNCCSDTNIIVPILKKVNKYFLKNCEIHIDDLKIYPIETEIYFVNDWFYDGMCHMHDLQKQHFGQLYFHRYKNSEKINLCRGGVDICISNKNYYLSILIRSAFIDEIKEEKFFSGITKIREKINPNTTKEQIDVLYKRNKNICDQIDTNNIRFQQRISGSDYAKGVEYYKLNCLNLGEKDKFLTSIISTGQTFYKKYNDSKKIEEYKKSLSHN